MLWKVRRGRAVHSGCGLGEVRVAALDAPIAPPRLSHVPAARICAFSRGSTTGRLRGALATRGGAVSAQKTRVL